MATGRQFDVDEVNHVLKTYEHATVCCYMDLFNNVPITSVNKIPTRYLVSMYGKHALDELKETNLFQFDEKLKIYRSKTFYRVNALHQTNPGNAEKYRETLITYWGSPLIIDLWNSLQDVPKVTKDGKKTALATMLEELEGMYDDIPEKPKLRPNGAEDYDEPSRKRLDA